MYFACPGDRSSKIFPIPKIIHAEYIYQYMLERYAISSKDSSRSRYIKFLRTTLESARQNAQCFEVLRAEILTTFVVISIESGHHNLQATEIEKLSKDIWLTYSWIALTEDVIEEGNLLEQHLEDCSRASLYHLLKSKHISILMQKILPENFGDAKLRDPTVEGKLLSTMCTSKHQKHPHCYGDTYLNTIVKNKIPQLMLRVSAMSQIISSSFSNIQISLPTIACVNS
jgi:hypothetical protein